jgi:hypothetical protein
VAEQNQKIDFLIQEEMAKGSAVGQSEFGSLGSEHFNDYI